jgi:hypothetical protein
VPPLNRSAIAITRKAPYAEWANRQAEAETDPVPFVDEFPRTVYLVGPVQLPDSLADCLDDFWQDIFEEELAAWSADEATWPEPLTRELFDAWFDAELTDGVVDLTPDEPITEDEAEGAIIDDVLVHCAWCDLEIGDGEARHVGIPVPQRHRLASREGLALTLFADDGQPLTGILSTEDSPAALSGEDLVFRVCSSRCEK